MSLSKEIIKQTSGLENLTDEQLSSIVTLSVNDENTVIARKTGEIYGNLDRDITEVLGSEKPDGKKTYDWLKQDVLPMVKKVSDYKTQIKTLGTEKAALEAKLASGEGIDVELKEQIAKKDQKISDMAKQFAADKKLLEEKVIQSEKVNFDLRMDFESKSAEVGIEFMDAIPESTRPLLISHARSEILAEYEVDSIDDGKGGKRTVFKKDGVIANNPDNGLNPYSLSDLYKIKLKDNLKTGNPKIGAGSNPKAGNPNGTTFDLTGVKTQIEANDMITKHLMDKGIARGTQEFTQEADKLHSENKVSELPIR